MSREASEFYWREQTHQGTQRLILLALADWASPYGVATPLMDLLRQRVNIGRTALYNNLALLEASGEIGVVIGGGHETKRGRGNAFYLNSYIVTIGREVKKTEIYKRKPSKKHEFSVGVQAGEPVGVQAGEPVGVQAGEPVGVQAGEPNTVFDTETDTKEYSSDSSDDSATPDEKAISSSVSPTKKPLKKITGVIGKRSGGDDLGDDDDVPPEYLTSFNKSYKRPTKAGISITELMLVDILKNDGGNKKIKKLAPEARKRLNQTIYIQGVKTDIPSIESAYLKYGDAYKEWAREQCQVIMAGMMHNNGYGMVANIQFVARLQNYHLHFIQMVQEVNAPKVKVDGTILTVGKKTYVLEEQDIPVLRSLATRILMDADSGKPGTSRQDFENVKRVLEGKGGSEHRQYGDVI